MKRLLEWKQRMLQSPLTRKSSRSASRTQTPTNSSSPVPSLLYQNDHLRGPMQQKFSDHQTNPNSVARRVSRKGSGASRTSRSRSSPRASNRPADSSSDEGKFVTLTRYRLKWSQICLAFCCCLRAPFSSIMIIIKCPNSREPKRDNFLTI